MPTSTKHPCVIVTGLSGSGLSSVLKTLEDFGFEAFDNYPLSLLPNLIAQDPRADKHGQLATQAAKPIALGVDTRSRDFDTGMILQICENYDAQLLFLTCDTPVLLKRFTETRRRHPMAIDRPIVLGIEEEREIMDGLQAHANHVIDTSELSIHDLRHILEGYFKPDTQGDLIVSLQSFGFRHGTPREADIIMDVRFLNNPHWVKDLKPLSGLDAPVGDYIVQDDGFGLFLENFKALITPLLPRYAHEGKSYLTIAIGCTGGRHRSVFSVETLGKWLKAQGFQTHIEHRDLKL